MKAAELLERYTAGERDFRGANLRGQSFKGQDLSSADFSGADIRSANFTGATLCRANFSEAKAGLQRRWAIGLLLASWWMAAVVGFFSAFAGVMVALIFSSEVPAMIAGWTSLIMLVVLLALMERQGTGAFAFAITVTVSGIFVFSVTSSVAILGTFIFAVAGAVAIAGTIAGAVPVADTVAVVVAVAVAVAVALISTYVGWRASKEDPRDAWIRSIAIAFAAIGGTSFRDADLTNATFNQATLKSTDFRRATLTHTNWQQAQKLDRARVGKTILLDPNVRELVISHCGAGQSYAGLDLRGAYLAGADLNHADLTEADISNATLEGAWLERANLTKTQALGTNFHQARLTGACLEAWNIDSTTRLKGAMCEYGYLLNGQKERRPSSGTFKPGEFAKLFEVLLDTIDLIFRNGLDWKAFATSFKQVQVENEGVELTIQSIENKGDGVVVVRVSAPPETDKQKIHCDFNRTYEAEFAALKAEYQTKLRAKEEQIVIYRQQSADMKEIVGLLASRPLLGGSKSTPDRTTRKILILAANPKNSSRLQLDREVREIDEGLRRSLYREQFCLDSKLAVQTRDVYRHLLDIQPQIIHFCGHGSGEAGIMLEDNNGRTQLLGRDAISSLFKLFASKGLECVLLNACYSEVQADAIAQHIPYVIGMSQAIGNKAATIFAVAFYDALGAGETVEFAFELGCSQLVALKEQKTPVLKKQRMGRER